MDLNHLAKTIVEFYEKLSSWEDAVVRDTGLTTAQAHTIEIIGHSGPIKMKDLAHRIGVTTGTLTVAVDKLENKNLLERKPCKTDRRAYLIELTDAGQKYFKQHHNFHIKMTQEIVADLTDEEQALFGMILEKMVKKI
nr:MarR family transcriptional regulator [uncultured Desulfobacter sp.]